MLEKYQTGWKFDEIFFVLDMAIPAFITLRKRKDNGLLIAF